MRPLFLLLLCLPLSAQVSAQSRSAADCRVVTDPTARLFCYDAWFDSQPKPAAAATTAPPAAAVATRPAEAQFGLPESRRPDAVEAMHSAVGASFSGWGPNSHIRLDNGQIWQVVDGSSVVLPQGARKVSVKRALFGGFTLEIEGLNTSPKVRRID